jgi:hypothetical protein
MEMLEENGDETEAFGEVSLHDSINGELLGVVPVTVVNDRPIAEVGRKIMQVGAQGSSRLHFNIPAGINFYRIKMRELEGDISSLVISHFNPIGIRTGQLRKTQELWVPVSQSGHHQVALAMSGGTTQMAKVEVEIETLNFSLKTKAVAASFPKIKIQADANQPVFAEIKLEPVGILRGSSFSNQFETITPLVFGLQINNKVTLVPRLSAMDQYDVSYLYGNCSAMVKEANGDEILFDASGGFTTPDDKERSVEFRCMPFDSGIKGHNSNREIGWLLEVFEKKSDYQAEVVNCSLNGNSEKQISLKPIPAGEYEVHIRSQLAQDWFKLGNLQAL